MLVLGLGGAAFSIATGNGLSVQISGMSLAAIVGIILNLMIKEEKELEIVKMSAIAHKRCAFSHTRTRVHKKIPIYLLKYFILEFAHSVISYNFIHYFYEENLLCD